MTCTNWFLKKQMGTFLPHYKKFFGNSLYLNNRNMCLFMSMLYNKIKIEIDIKMMNS